MELVVWCDRDRTEEENRPWEGHRGRNASHVLEKFSELNPEEVVGVKVRVKGKRVPGRGDRQPMPRPRGKKGSVTCSKSFE